MHTIIFSLQFLQEKRNSNVHGAKKGSDMEVFMWWRGRSLEDGWKLGGWKRERTYINIGGVQLE